MADTTEIAWTDSTFNPWIGCTKVGPGCDNCYAEREFDHRHHRAKWGHGQDRQRTSKKNWNLPLRWNAKPFYECPGCGWRGDDPTKRPRCPTCEMTHMLKPARRRVFCSSLADVFDNEVPEEWRADLFALIDQTPNLDWLLLTKRIGNLGRMIPDWWSVSLPPNVWIGATIVNQSEADRDIPKLLALPTRVRFLSMEPLLGPVDLRFHIFSEPTGNFRTHAGKRQMELRKPADGGLHWVIVGGESGPSARPMHPGWVQSLRDQCLSSGVAFLFKQWGEWTPGVNVERHTGVVKTATWLNSQWSFGEEDLATDDGHIDDEPDLYRVGKQYAGRYLDGLLHNEFPEVKR